MFLVLKARGASMHHFLNLFSSKDFVSNDRIVGHWLRGRVVHQLAWSHLKPADQFRTPTSIMIAGPSGCGKTVFTTRLLLENSHLFSTTPNTIHYCYGSWQHGFELLKNVASNFMKACPTAIFYENGLLKEVFWFWTI